jgi:catechol 2,3-dioxygenase-like lactoylglutathione lyase family enzyme
MIDHISTYAVDFDCTFAFYRQALKPLGYNVVTEFVLGEDDNPDFPGQRVCALGDDDSGSLWIIETRQAASPRHFAFRAADREVVMAFHRKALLANGTDNGAPGVRSHYHADYFGAFILDPDGNNVEAVCHQPV